MSRSTLMPQGRADRIQHGVSSKSHWHMARTPAMQQALSNAEPGHRQSSGLFVPGEGSGLWPDAACKAG